MEIITIKPQGFAPKWYENSYPSYGNKNHAGNMRNIDLTDPSVMTQGRGVADLTNGTQAGAITTLVKGMTNAVTSNIAYGVGGAKLQQFSATAVTNEGSFPHTIDKAAVTGEDGEDVLHYKGALYYSYNHSGSTGDVGKFDLSSTFDDDFMSTTTGGAALQDAPHQMIMGGDDVMYIANGIYISKYNGTTFTEDALDFWDDSEVSSITWNHNRVIAAVNRPNLSGTNANQSAVYTWTGYDDSWEGDPIEVNGRIGALFTKNGITYIWYESFKGSSVRNTFGYLSGGRVIPLTTFAGSLPLYYQVGERDDYIVWLSDNRVYSYGSLSGEAVTFSQYMSSVRATGGGLATPFGEIIVASTASTNYNLSKESGYATDAYWYTMMFNVSTGQQLWQIDSIVIWTEEMSANAKLDTTLRYNAGVSNQALDQIAYAASKPTRHIIGKSNLPRVEDFRLELAYANGNSTNPVKIKQIEISGHPITNK